MAEREKGRIKKSKKPASKAKAKKAVKVPLVLDFSDPATVRAKLHGYDSVEEARADTVLFDFSSEYWQIDDDDF